MHLSMNKVIYDVINEALDLWVDATGVDPRKKSWSFGDFDLYQANQELKESQNLDHTALTTYLLLRAEARQFASDQPVNALELLEEPSAVLKRTGKLRKLLATLNHPACVAEVKRFQSGLRKMAKACGFKGVFEKLINDTQKLAYIRRDALRAFKGLTVNHFAIGKRGEGQPKYNPVVIKFWNMNSVVRFAEVQPEDGISLVMVRDPVDLHSYFCFLVKNGKSIVIYSDIPDDPHPLHKHMSRARAQERAYEDRAYQLRFPYQLFNFEFSDEGRFKGEKHKNALAPVNIKAVRVKPIRNLEEDQALWTMMMFDLLAQEHWREMPKPAVLSYHGEGMVSALPAPKGKGALISPGFSVVAELTRDDMTRKKLSPVFEQKPTGQNNWLEDRYKDKVPVQVYNLIGSGKVFRLLDGRNGKPKGMVPKSQPPEGAIVNVNTIAIHPKSTNLSLLGVDPTSFGTPKQMESDRRWVARYNEACIIQAEANREFKARTRKVVKWYQEKVTQNLPRLLKSVAVGKFRSEIQGLNPEETFDYGRPMRGDILSQWAYKHGPLWSSDDTVRLFRDSYSPRGVYCWISKYRASIWTSFQPWTPVSLAHLAGCKVQELPDVLQHWYRNDRYVGNPILDRLDPMDWDLENPWRSLHFEVVLGLSKRAFNKVCKDHGVPKRIPPTRER